MYKICIRFRRKVSAYFAHKDILPNVLQGLWKVVIAKCEQDPRKWPAHCMENEISISCSKYNEPALVSRKVRLKAAPQLKRLVAGFPPRRPGFKPGSSHVGFVVDKVALGQVFSEHFGFPCQSSFHQFLHNYHHLSSGAGTIGQ
jgi:hypothetical protein